MSYRTYIGRLSKSKHEEIKNLSVEELYTKYEVDYEDDWLGMYNIIDEKHLYEFGRYTEFDDEKFFTAVFENKDTQQHYIEEHDFWIVDKEFLEHIINFYKEKIQTYYNNMVIPFFGGSTFGEPSEFLNTVESKFKDDDTFGRDYTYDFSKMTQDEVNAFHDILHHVRSMRNEWTYLTPYNLEKGDGVTKSWKYEYAIFELVRIYKTFDWGNNLLVYYGY